MKITEADVEHVAALANLEVTEGERKDLSVELSRILDYVEQLKKLDLARVEPTPQITTSAKQAMREDRIAPRIGSSEAGRTVKFFKVPKVITER